MNFLIDEIIDLFVHILQITNGLVKIEIKNEGKSMEKVAKEFNHILSQKEIAKDSTVFDK